MLPCQNRTGQERKAVGMIKKLLSTTGNVSVKLATKLFESKIEPILTYGSIIWATEKSANQYQSPVEKLPTKRMYET